MIYRKVGQAKISTAVVHQLETLILEGILKPGDRIPPERELSETMDVSRPTLREALHELEERGLLLARQGGGTFVADVMGSVFAEPIVGLFSSHAKATTDYLEFREEMESTVTGLAAERATEADRQIIAAIFEEMRASHQASDSERETALDVQFHAAISDASHNIVMIQTLRSIYNLLVHGVFYNRTLLYGYRDARQRLFEQHRAIHDAIMAGDKEQASMAARAHMRYVRETIAHAETEQDREQTAGRRLSQFRLSGWNAAKKKKVAS